MSAALQVRSIMNAEVMTLDAATPIRRAVALLIEANQPAAPVVSDHGTLVGILTQKDCFKPALYAGYYQEWKGVVADHMSDGPITIDASDDLTHAAEMFITHPHRVFPVLDDGKVAGLLDRGQVLAALVESG